MLVLVLLVSISVSNSVGDSVSVNGIAWCYMLVLVLLGSVVSAA